MTDKLILAGLVTGFAIVGLFVSDFNFWVIAVLLLAISQFVMPTYGVALSKRIKLNDNEIRERSRQYSNIYFSVVIIIFTFSHIFQLSNDVTIIENIILVFVHAAAVVFFYWISRNLFSTMYSRGLEEYSTNNK